MRYVGHTCSTYPILLYTIHFLNRRCSLSNALPRERQGTPLQFHCNVSCRGGACCSAADGTPLSFGHLPNGETPPEAHPADIIEMRSKCNALLRERQGTPLQFHCNVSCRGGACSSRNPSNQYRLNAKQINYSVGMVIPTECFSSCSLVSSVPTLLIFAQKTPYKISQIP